jgi:hypothetical protein
MALLVKYKNDGTGYISNYELNSLIDSGKIDAFMRSNGEWVDPQIGPIRGQGSPKEFNGPERRSRW